jgi:cholesterol oxidase
LCLAAIFFSRPINGHKQHNWFAHPLFSHADQPSCDRTKKMSMNCSMEVNSRRNVIKASVAAAVAAATPGASADFAPVRSLPVIVRRATSNSSEWKRRAIADYVENMRGFGGSLAQHGRCLLQPSERNCETDFDILIIGSGYGGSICAARLAMAKRPAVRLALLERGREWIPGTFPDTLRQGTRESRFTLLGPRQNELSNPVGLVNVIQNDEVNILSGNGLGGSSLINANVAIRPDADCFQQSVWPVALQEPAFLDPYFDRAALELGVATEPIDGSPKARAQRLAAQKLAACGAQFENAALTLTRGQTGNHPIINRQGMNQRGCIDCGDCTSGCNVGAKNTLAANYLPLARRHGAELYTHTEVLRIEKVGTHYRVHFKNYTPARRGKFTEACGSVTTRIVIVGAGSIGSSEILLRSRGCGMELSDRVGHQWTMNGDALGFVRKSSFLTNTAGRGAYETCHHPTGPTIQTNLTYPHRELSQRVLIQDGAVTKSYANILGTLMLDLDLDDTLPMLGMGHDGANGRVVLREDGFGAVKWPGMKESQYRRMIRREFDRVAQAHGGEYKYLRIFGDNLITVHPLGGCAMADDPLYGVVDDRGRVFDGRGGGMVESYDSTPLLGEQPLPRAMVHHGFYVADGSIIPTSIGCNPLLTISALAERISDGIVTDPAYRDLFSI